MANSKSVSIKHVLIDKTNSTIVGVTSLAVFIVIFSLFSSNTLISQMHYQDRVIAAKTTALNQLKLDVQANDHLITAYKAFISSPINIIGGSTTGNSSNSGDNGKIILDALPSKYDFPALTTSIDKLLGSEGVNVQSIGGVDQQLVEQSTPSSGNPQPIPMPFNFTVTGAYQNIQNVVDIFQSSIRPFQFQTLKLSGDQSDLSMAVTAQTYFQPERYFNITSEVVQ